MTKIKQVEFKWTMNVVGTSMERASLEMFRDVLKELYNGDLDSMLEDITNKGDYEGSMNSISLKVRDS